jgi:type II secretory pathway component GspD/PulD (secretin)
LLVYADADKTGRMWKILDDLGEAVKPTMTTIRVRNVNAEAVARTLTEVFKSTRIVAAPGTDQIVVYATPNDLATIRKLVELLDAAPVAAPARVPAIPMLQAPPTFTMEFRAAPWADIVEWYAKTSGLTFVGQVKPTGTVTLTPGKDKKFTLAEVTDLLNEALIQNKMLLVRREKTFTIIPADEKPDPSLFLRVVLDGVPDRGKTELVEVVITLAKEQPVKEYAEEIKKMLGPFGELQTITARNAVLVRDTAGNIQRIREVIKP